jgi:hypothetical protein
LLYPLSYEGDGAKGTCHGVTVVVYAFDIAGDRIKHIWAVLNPEKLRPWTTG